MSELIMSLLSMKKKNDEIQVDECQIPENLEKIIMKVD
jgi:hypothetical protein